MNNIRLIFVLSSNYSEECEAPEIMLQAYEACKQNIDINVSWVKESNFETIELNKTDFVIFEDFKGKNFVSLRETKCARILGPWAVSVCLMEGKSIPNFPWPIYNVTMYGCIVACSNFPKTIKMEIKEKVQMMGGCYVDKLLATNTHLITNSPKSEKYLVAAESGVKLMCSSWVDAVWEAGQTLNIHANDDQFKKHRCLPFQNLYICSTGITNSHEKKVLERMVTENGGKFTGRLNLAQTDILVCIGGAGASSEKYKAARKHSSIKCVTVDWITDSVDKGYALPHNLYPLKKSTSTPTKQEYMNPDFSVLSAIHPNTSERAVVDDTVNATSLSNFASPLKSGPSKRKGSSKEEYGRLVDTLEIKKAKRAGQYLDGLSVYVTGFSPEHTEKLSKILNLSGATRYDNFSDRVTHVIVGDPSYHEVKIIKSKGYQCCLVSVQWLLDCIDKKHSVTEDDYILSTSDIDRSEFNSPLSKKGLNLLRSNKTVTEKELEDSQEHAVVNNADDNVENDILQQYLRPGTSVQENDTLARLLENVDPAILATSNQGSAKQMPPPKNPQQVQDPPTEMPLFKPSDTSTQQSTMTVTQDESCQGSILFEGLKFLIIGFENDLLEKIKSAIEGCSGEVVSKGYQGIPDFAVVPVFNDSEIHHTATEIVNEIFIMQCVQEGEFSQEISYYHRPFYLPDASPLENCIITFSSYCNFERSFLKSLTESLGGQCQEQFARVTNEAKGVVASTHLISSETSGKKYTAALKWGLPVITKDWLLECARTGKYVPETDYLIGDAKASKLGSPADKQGSLSSNSKSASKDSNISEHPTISNNGQPQEIVNLPGTSFNTPEVSRKLNASGPNTSSGAGPSKTPLNTPGTSKSFRVLTPSNQVTPKNQRNTDSTEKPYSQVTPVNKIFKKFRDSQTQPTTPETPVPLPWMGITTPETPLERNFTDKPDKQLRKEFAYWISRFPDYIPPQPRRLSTPLSEIKRKLWEKISYNSPEGVSQNIPSQPNFGQEEMEVEPIVLCPPGENTQNQNLLNNNLQELEKMLGASVQQRRQSRNFQSTITVPGNQDFKESQGTVGWDFKEPENVQKQKIFVISGIGSAEERTAMVTQIESLGASVSELTNYDPTCTHLLCPKPARNEKSLSCMAAGKWILHTSYLSKSLEAGRFLDEEEYEFGNPKSSGNIPIQYDRETETRMNSMHWWRKEISRRGYGAFNDMRAIIMAQKREPIVRVVEAGGGVVIDVRPPFDDTVHATHCMLEQRSISDFTQYIPLAQQGIYVVNTVFISEYLHHPNKDIRDCILPYFAKYYART